MHAHVYTSGGVYPPTAIVFYRQLYTAPVAPMLENKPTFYAELPQVFMCIGFVVAEHRNYSETTALMQTFGYTIQKYSSKPSIKRLCVNLIHLQTQTLTGGPVENRIP